MHCQFDLPWKLTFAFRLFGFSFRCHTRRWEAMSLSSLPYDESLTTSERLLCLFRIWIVKVISAIMCPYCWMDSMWTDCAIFHDNVGNYYIFISYSVECRHQWLSQSVNSILWNNTFSNTRNCVHIVRRNMQFWMENLHSCGEIAFVWHKIPQMNRMPDNEKSVTT